MTTPFVLGALVMMALATAVGLTWWLWRQAQPQLRQATLMAALDVYKRAWEQQDAALILTIFRPDAVYHERVLREPIRGHDGIAAYWQAKVVQGAGAHPLHAAPDVHRRGDRHRRVGGVL